MNNDPIVEEVHAIRDRLAAQFGYDISQIFADLRTRERLLGDRLKNRQKSRRKPTHHPNDESSGSEMHSSPAAG
ncbi:MAG: hypothetical protein KF752_15455 [Pirellulaceae bacterium]|nr:hypothetical protein [Pirellulaceae bacterium]